MADLLLPVNLWFFLFILCHSAVILWYIFWFLHWLVLLLVSLGFALVGSLAFSFGGSSAASSPGWGSGWSVGLCSGWSCRSSPGSFPGWSFGDLPVSPLLGPLVGHLVHLRGYSSIWNFGLDSFILCSHWSSDGSGGALSVVGEALQRVAQAKDALDVNIKHTFIDPLQDLHNMELKETRVRGMFSKFWHLSNHCIQNIMEFHHHVVVCCVFRLALQYQLKKVNSCRLDFDYKRRQSGKVPAEEIQQAREKFLMSKELAEGSMFAVLQNDVSLMMIISDWTQTGTQSTQPKY